MSFNRFSFTSKYHHYHQSLDIGPKGFRATERTGISFHLNYLAVSQLMVVLCWSISRCYEVKFCNIWRPLQRLLPCALSDSAVTAIHN